MASMIEYDNRAIMRNSYAALSELYQTNIPIEFEQLKSAQYYPFSETNPIPSAPFSTQHATKMYVREIDVFELAREIFQTTGKPACVLNCANSYNVGGGFNRTRGSQEEYLFRNSTLVASLWPHRRSDDERCPEMDKILPRHPDTFYQISPYGGIYSPTVFVTGIADQPLVKQDYFPCTVVSAAAMDLRLKTAAVQGRLPFFDYNVTIQKLRSILHIAAIHGQEYLILTAIGCGAFKNPPEEVARAFKELLTTEFQGVFVEVVFAIYHGNSSTLNAFQSAFPIK